jgi:molecular chaperone GrpE
MHNQEDNIMESGNEQEQNANSTDIKTENTASETEKEVNSSETTEAKINELNDKYLRLYSEFDNYRKRTLKERSELIKTASEDVFKAILPVIDDLDRAVRANETVDDASLIREGLNLIAHKLHNVAQQKGLIAFESKGLAFDPDVMEAITHIPAASEDEKGKVVDEIEKGYKLGDKVIRFAKVVVGQ